jgi:hypothetical protein
MPTRRFVIASLAVVPLSACETLDPTVLDGLIGGAGGANGTAGLSGAEVALGLKAALDNGIGNALVNLGRLDGFLGDPTVRIPLPKTLRDVQSVLAPIGADGLLVELQQQLNRGAEAAVPVAKDIFVDAVRGLTIQDAFAILRGPATAATDYLQARTTDSLIQGFSPIMESALANTGALRLVDQVSQQVPVGLVTGGTDLRTDLVRHGVEFGLKGVFHYIGEEEAAIRANPAKRTSEILRRVFS